MQYVIRMDRFSIAERISTGMLKLKTPRTITRAIKIWANKRGRRSLHVQSPLKPCSVKALYAGQRELDDDETINEEEYRGFILCEGCERVFLLPTLKESDRQKNLLNKLHAAKWQKFSLA